MPTGRRAGLGDSARSDASSHTPQRRHPRPKQVEPASQAPSPPVTVPGYEGTLCMTRRGPWALSNSRAPPRFAARRIRWTSTDLINWPSHSPGSSRVARCPALVSLAVWDSSSGWSRTARPRPGAWGPARNAGRVRGRKPDAAVAPTVKGGGAGVPTGSRPAASDVVPRGRRAPAASA